VVGVDTAAAARATLQTDADIDLVLLDLALGDADGFDVLAEFRAAYPAVPVVVVSASERASDVIRAIDNGAMGFVPKRSRMPSCTEALGMVMSGARCTCRRTCWAWPSGARRRGDTEPGVMRPVPDSASMPLGSAAPAPSRTRRCRR
jgi:DNA-binding NarL/FixJ family response regulator